MGVLFINQEYTDNIGRHEVLLPILIEIINTILSKDLRKHKKLVKNSENPPFHDFVRNFGFCRCYGDYLEVFDWFI